MSNKEWVFRIHDMLSAIAELEEYILPLSKDDFRDNIPLLRTAERNIEIIGEAANKIPKTIQTQYPDIQRSDIITMRNIIIHNYNDVDYTTIWDTLENDIPKLKTALLNIINEG